MKERSSFLIYLNNYYKRLSSNKKSWWKFYPRTCTFHPITFIFCLTMRFILSRTQVINPSSSLTNWDEVRSCTRKLKRSVLYPTLLVMAVANLSQLIAAEHFSNEHHMNKTFCMR